MEDRITLNEWVKQYDEGQFDSPDVDTMIDAGWHDWFCSDTSLKNRMKRMVGMVKAAAESPLVDAYNVYVFFKNNAPLFNPNYDSFSIANMSDDNVIWWVTAKYTPLGYAVVLRGPLFDIDDNLIKPGGNANTVKKFFKNGTLSE